MDNQNKNNYFLAISVLIAGIMIAGAVIYSNGLKEFNKQKEDVSDNSTTTLQIDDDVVLGDVNAPVTIIIVGDYQCPYCAKFAEETEPLIFKDYVQANKAKLVFKDYVFLGVESANAAMAVECARDQESFWAFNKAIYQIEYAELQKVISGEIETSENNGNLNRDLFEKIVNDLGINVDNFLACYDQNKYKDEIEKDINDVELAMNGKVSTPTIFINGKMIQGAYPYETFKQAIDEALK